MHVRTCACMWAVWKIAISLFELTQAFDPSARQRDSRGNDRDMTSNVMVDRAAWHASLRTAVSQNRVDWRFGPFRMGRLIWLTFAGTKWGWSMREKWRLSQWSIATCLVDCPTAKQRWKSEYSWPTPASWSGLASTCEVSKANQCTWTSNKILVKSMHKRKIVAHIAIAQEILWEHGESQNSSGASVD